MLVHDSAGEPAASPAPLPSLRVRVRSPVVYQFRGEEQALPPGEYRMSRLANCVRFESGTPGSAPGSGAVHVMHAKNIPRLRAAGHLEFPAEA